ncbi:hypothetical protein ACFLU5_11635 [Bacteroidota bacterium]
MKNSILFFVVCFIFLMGHYLSAQEVEKLYTGRGYWFEEQHERYQAILNKKEADQILSAAEEQWFDDFHAYLKDYFSRLSEIEKEKYFTNKTTWDAEREGIIIEQEKIESPPDETESLDVLETNVKGIQPGKKYLMYNGLYGFLYGMGLVAIIEPMDATVLAIPLATTGLGLLWPVLNSKRYESIPYNSVLLARHGKFMGGIHGLAVGLSAFGTESTYSGKGIVALGILGSMAGSEIGYQMGKRKDWTEGRVATYKHYGVLIPLLNFFTLAGSRVDDPRIYGGATLISGAAGYWIGDKVADHFDNTRGDILALGSFTALSSMLTIAFIDFDRTTDIFVPISGAIAGTVAGHIILKNKKLTAKEGWRVNYVTGAGVLLGLGIAVITSSESEHHAPFLILPAVGGGLGWYGMLNSSLNERGNSTTSDTSKWSYLSVDFTPENYYFNKSTWKLQSETFNPGLPVIGLNYNF